MKNLTNIEVFNIETKDGELYANISYQDLNNITNANNGYNWICVPINLRDKQISIRGNMLVNQSFKQDLDVAVTNCKHEPFSCAGLITCRKCGKDLD